MKHRTAILLTFFLLPFVPSHGFGNPPASANADQKSLQSLQELIGQWKGVGQVRRGSAQGSWIEVGDWAWDFADGKSAVTFAAPASKHLLRGTYHGRCPARDAYAHGPHRRRPGPHVRRTSS